MQPGHLLSRREHAVQITSHKIWLGPNHLHDMFGTKPIFHHNKAISNSVLLIERTFVSFGYKQVNFNCMQGLSFYQ
jgi:hypothetical protein